MYDYHIKPLCGKELWKYCELRGDLGVVEKRR